MLANVRQPPSIVRLDPLREPADDPPVITGRRNALTPETTPPTSLAAYSGPGDAVHNSRRRLVAFQGSNGHLFIYDISFNTYVDTGLGMASETSPSIGVDSGTAS